MTEPTNAPVIVVEDLSKVYQLGDVELRALDHVNLKVDRGLFGAATGNARLVTIAGAEHAAMPGDSLGVVRRETLAWFDQWLGAGSCLAGPR